MTCIFRPGPGSLAAALVAALSVALVTGVSTATAVGADPSPTTSTWTVQPSPNPAGAVASGLAAVSCSGPGTCVAVGAASYPSGGQIPNQGVLVEQLSDGTWTIGTTPAIGDATSSSLDAVSCPVTSFCVAVGSVQLMSQSLPDLLVESWNGTSWSDTILPTPSGGNDPSLAGVSCAAAGECVAVGDSYREHSSNYRLLTERLHGSTWSIVPSPVPPHGAGGDSQFTAVDCLSTSRCEAVGNVFYNDTLQKGLAYGLNGSTWTYQRQVNLGPDPDTIESAVSCSGADACTSVGTVAIVGELALAEYWDGSTWVRQATPETAKRPNDSLLDVSCHGGSSCVSVGESYKVNPQNGHLTHARVLGEVWNGATWSQSQPVVPSGVSAGLAGISCPAPASCIAVGAASTSTSAATLVEEYTG